MFHLYSFDVRLPEDDISRWKHVAIQVDCSWNCIFWHLSICWHYVLKKMLYFRKTRLIDIHHAACINGDVCYLKDHPICAWFESQSEHWLYFLRCFMFFLFSSFLLVRWLVTTPLRHSCSLLQLFILIFANCVVFRHYIIWNTLSVVK